MRYYEGLSKVYQLHYMRPKLALIDADDDCGIDTILDVLADEDDLAEERFGWIPETVAKCLYYNDASDSDMRSRVIQIIGESLSSKTINIGAIAVFVPHKNYISCVATSYC